MLRLLQEAVVSLTAICGGVALAFLCAGGGEPVVRLLAFVILVVAALNLALRRLERWSERNLKKPMPK